MREAKFPLIKTMEGFDPEAAVGLDLRLLREMATGDYIKKHRNIIFMGRSGTGKSHLATALGIEACRQNIRTRFVSCYGLVNELIEAREEHLLRRLIARYCRYELLILDELGYIPFSKEGAELLFQILAERHEKGSVIITTNLGFADWSQVFGDPIMTGALLDRLTHRAHIIPCDWDSYRLKLLLEHFACSVTRFSTERPLSGEIVQVKLELFLQSLRPELVGHVADLEGFAGLFPVLATLKHLRTYTFRNSLVQQNRMHLKTPLLAWPLHHCRQLMENRQEISDWVYRALKTY